MTTHSAVNTGAASARRPWLYTLSAAAAAAVGLLLLLAAISFKTAVLFPATGSGWFPALQNNWLVTIFKVHAGFPGVSTDLLRGVDALDIVLLALTGLSYPGLYAALKTTSRAWSIVAAVQPFLGIVLFIATKTAGRSGVMGAGLVISLVMLNGKIFSKTTAYIGILASVLLLAGDFSAGAIPPSAVIAALFALGYALMVVWFFLVTWRLIQLSR